MSGRILLTTYSNEEFALKQVQRVVEAGLAACGNVIKVKSKYVWKGKIEDADEYLVLFKTTEKSLKKLMKNLEKNHPYEIPELVSIKIASINNSYLDWLQESVNSKTPRKKPQTISR